MAFKMRSKLWKSGPMKPTSKLSVDIPDAASKATRFITELTNGIFVHPEGKGPDDTQTPTGWSMLDALQYIMDGVSRFWVGVKSGASHVTMRFGAEDESRMELDYRSMSLVDKDDSVYFSVGDKRDAEGVAAVAEVFVMRRAGINGSAAGVDLSLQYVGHTDRVPENATATIGPDLSTVTATATRIAGIQNSHTYVWCYFPDGTQISPGDILTVTYETEEDAKQFAFGSSFGPQGIMAASFGTGNTTGTYALANGEGNAAVGISSHAEGLNSVATGYAAHAEGMNRGASDATWQDHGSTASGVASHAEGEATVASGYASHAEGGILQYRESGAIVMTYIGTEANGEGSHAEGEGCVADGDCSHAQNRGTVAGYDDQTAIGRFNENKSANLFEIGNGTTDANRSNAFEVDGDGNVHAAGKVVGTHKLLASKNGWHMNVDQIITLPENISEQANGIVIAWSEYANGAAMNSSWHYQFIPKSHGTSHSGQGVSTLIIGSDGYYCARKYVYVYDDRIEGTAQNVDTGAEACGITFTNTRWVLREVWGV